MFPPGVAPVTDRKRFCASRGEAAYIPLDLTGGPKLVAASLTCLSRQEGVLPCLRTSPPLGGTLEVHRTSWRILFSRHACMFLVLGFPGAWMSQAPPRVPKQRRP